MLVPLLLASRAPPPPPGAPTSPVLAALSPLLGAPAFLRLHVKVRPHPLRRVALLDQRAQRQHARPKPPRFPDPAPSERTRSHRSPLTAHRSLLSSSTRAPSTTSCRSSPGTPPRWARSSAAAPSTVRSESCPPVGRRAHPPPPPKTLMTSGGWSGTPLSRRRRSRPRCARLSLTLSAQPQRLSLTAAPNPNHPNPHQVRARAAQPESVRLSLLGNNCFTFAANVLAAASPDSD